jgi:hypothetical protein
VIIRPSESSPLGLKSRTDDKCTRKLARLALHTLSGRQFSPECGTKFRCNTMLKKQVHENHYRINIETATRWTSITLSCDSRWPSHFASRFDPIPSPLPFAICLYLVLPLEARAHTLPSTQSHLPCDLGRSSPFASILDSISSLPHPDPCFHLVLFSEGPAHTFASPQGHVAHLYSAYRYLDLFI